MAKQTAPSGSDGTSLYNAVFIDTSLGTHLVTVISSSETVADLKKKILHEHALCFPHLGDIKIHALKVKRRGKFYYLSESMLVKSVFHGMNKSWFISVDAYSSEEHYESRHFLNSNHNNLLAPASTMTAGLANVALPEISSSPQKLRIVADNQLRQRNASCDEHLGVDVARGEGSMNMEVGLEPTEGNHEDAKSPVANDRSSPSMQEKGEYYDEEDKIQKASVEGGEISSKNEIRDKTGRTQSEERAAETRSLEKKKKKRKRKGKHDADDIASKEDNPSVPESDVNRSQNETVAPVHSLGNVHGVVSHGMGLKNDNIVDEPSTILSSDANKATATIAQRSTVLSEDTGELEKHVELSRVESRKDNVDMQQDQSVEENSKSEPAAKRSSKNKKGEKGDEELLKDDGTLVSESNKPTLEHSTISQNLQVDKQNKRNATLDGSSIVTPKAVHLQSVSRSSEKKKRKKKSAKTLNQEIAAVPSSATGVELVSGQHVRDLISSEIGAVSLKEKHGDPIQELHLRPSSLEIDTGKDADIVEGGHEASGSAIASNSKRKKVSKGHRAIGVENNPCLQGQASDKTEKNNEVSMHENVIHNVHQNHVTGQNDKIEEEQVSTKFSPKIAPSENHKTSAPDNVDSKTKEMVVASELPEATGTMDASRSSKKRKKSKKTKGLLIGKPSTSFTEHVKGFASGASPIEPHKAAHGGHPDDTFDKEESRPQKEVKEALEMDTTSNSLLPSNMEINDVIRNVVESIQQIGEDQVDTEIMHKKSKKKARKKQRSDAKHVQESEKENEVVGKNPTPLSTDNTEELKCSSKVTKKATLENKNAINQSIGSSSDCGKEAMVENDLGTQSVQVQPNKLESNSEKRSAYEGTNEVSCESSGVNFNYYFAPRKRDVDTVGPNEMLVDGSSKTKGSYDGTKVKKNKKKRDAHSDGPLSEFQTSQKVNDNSVAGAKPQTGNSSTAEVQVSVANAESENITLQPNKEPLELSDRGAKVLPSGNSRKLISVPEEARQSDDIKLTVISAHAKSKKTESDSGLESSKNSISQKRTVDACQSLEGNNHVDGRKASAINTGEVVNSSQKQKSLIGISGSIFKDDSDEAYSSKDGDSDTSTRTPSGNLLSSDYSDEESNADSNLTQNGSYSLKRKEAAGKTAAKPLGSSGMSLDTILRSSSRYKKAKLTASQSLLEDTESQPVDFVPESQPGP